jgi:hypothetical protein
MLMSLGVVSREKEKRAIWRAEDASKPKAKRAGLTSFEVDWQADPTPMKTPCFSRWCCQTSAGGPGKCTAQIDFTHPFVCKMRAPSMLS